MSAGPGSFGGRANPSGEGSSMPAMPSVSDHADTRAAAVGPGAAVGPIAFAVLKALLNVVVPAVVVILVWTGFLALFHLDPFVAKSPHQVWSYLFADSGDAQHRAHIAANLARTLLDAGTGFAAGLAAAVAMALLFVLVRGAEETILPIAVVIRSLPLAAMTPLVALIFGRGLLGTTVICGIVVYFPALVLFAQGLRSAPATSADLCRAYGAGQWTITRKVLIPSALPSLFAGARVGVPGALVGAMLAEWLATGKGLGYAMLQDTNTFEYTDLWASVAVLTTVSVALYGAVTILQTLVLRRFADSGARHS
jgi:ABC-type nitrate/sulfonate/bicarbonate transport system permease component